MLKITSLTKEYVNKKILQEVDLFISPTDKLGLVGPNGAGKSSIIQMLLNLRPPILGKISINGKDSSLPESREKIGYLSEWVEFPLDWKAVELIQLHRNILNLPRVKLLEIQEYLAIWGLEDNGKKLKSWSKGMRQRLALALSQLNEPLVWILDEPNTGLDPLGIALLNQRIGDERVKGNSVLLSSHRLAEIYNTAQRVLVVNKGRVCDIKKMNEFPSYSDLESWFLEKVGH